MTAGVTAEEAPVAVVIKADSLRGRMWRRFIRNRFAIVGGLTIAFFSLGALLAPLITPYDPDAVDLLVRLEPPSSGHPLGTDSFGRDVLARMLYGTRVSLLTAVAAVGILSTLGVVVGAVSAYYSGTTDQLLMRLVDLLLSVPQFFLLLLIVAVTGPSVLTTVLVIGLTTWMGMARLTRGEILALKSRDFVLAARSLGAPDWRIILHHLLPNALTIIVVNATLMFSVVIVLESSLSYLGLGAQSPTPTWGNILLEGRRYMREAWWIIAFPGLAIFLTAMSFNFLGDGLRDAFDPRMKDVLDK